ncbi:MAG: hypothetical protein QF805_01580 [Pirellulaceae bacterium]|nr:hypothetical protein [Pirellulaceae bacterium]
MIPRSSLFSRQLSLRGVFGLVVLAAIGMSIMHYIRREDRIRKNRLRFEVAAAALTSHRMDTSRLPDPSLYIEGRRVAPSWRSILVDYLDTGMWGGQRNRVPTAADAEFVFCRDGESGVSVMAVVGPGTAFGDSATSATSAALPADLILCVEVVGAENTWPEPVDFDVRWLDDPHPTIRIGAPGSDGFHVVFADGSVWRLRSDTPREKLKSFLTVSAAENADRDQTLSPHRL